MGNKNKKKTNYQNLLLTVVFLGTFALIGGVAYKMVNFDKQTTSESVATGKQTTVPSNNNNNTVAENESNSEHGKGDEKNNSGKADTGNNAASKVELPKKYPSFINKDPNSFQLDGSKFTYKSPSEGTKFAKDSLKEITLNKNVTATQLTKQERYDSNKTINMTLIDFSLDYSNMEGYEKIQTKVNDSNPNVSKEVYLDKKYIYTITHAANNKKESKSQVLPENATITNVLTLLGIKDLNLSPYHMVNDLISKLKNPNNYFVGENDKELLFYLESENDEEYQFEAILFNKKDKKPIKHVLYKVVKGNDSSSATKIETIYSKWNSTPAIEVPLQYKELKS